MAASEEGWPRRRLLQSSAAAAAGYALAAGPVRAEAIRTDASGLIVGEVEIPTGDGSIPAYRAQPEARTGLPVLLVVHEIFGVHEYIRDVCRRLAREGYLAVAPDLYQRQGDVAPLEEIEPILEIVRRVPDEQVLADLDGARRWADGAGGDASRTAITGFCWGGRIVWLYSAHAEGLRAGVAWYGRLAGAGGPQAPRAPLDLAEELKAPVLGLYGGADRGIPQSQVRAMREKLVLAGGRSEIAVFPGAPHGFHADYRASYRAMAASEGWRRMLEWLRRHGAV